MQLYALDDAGTRFFIFDAEKGKDYFCIECGTRVRVRSGSQRASHFYHVYPDRECRQAGKSEEHILLQAHIQKQIGAAFCEQEVRFPEISRIADVAWASEKIVFEIQCSSICKEEIEARCTDYAKMGWYVVWILLDKTFLRYGATDVILLLQNRTHYFASSDGPFIYDLFSWVENGRRKYVSKNRFEIDLATLTKNELEEEGKLPTFLAQRISSWRYFARKDLLWQHQQNAHTIHWQRLIEASITLQEKESCAVKSRGSTFHALWHYIVESALLHRGSK